MSDQDTTITADGLAQMLEQFKQSTNLRNLASSYLDQAQAFEDAIWPLLGERSLVNATGDRLDRIGQLFKEPRAGRDDTDYRAALTAEIAVLTSNGTAEELLALVDLLVQMGTPDYELTEYFPKGLVIRPTNFVVSRATAKVVGSALKRAAAAATSTHFVYSSRTDAFTFVNSTQGAVVDTGTNLGLGSVPTYGSYWLYDASATALSGLAAGDLRFNHAKPHLATAMFVHDTDGLSADKSTFLSGLLNSSLSIRHVPERIMALVTGVTDNTGTFTIDLEIHDSIGTIVDNDDVYLFDYDDGGVLSGVT